MNKIVLITFVVCVGSTSGESCSDAYSMPRADPKNCGRYLECIAGELKQFICPSGLHFNPSAHVCDYPKIAGCVILNSDETSKTEKWPVSIKTTETLPASSTTETWLVSSTTAETLIASTPTETSTASFTTTETLSASSTTTEISSTITVTWPASSTITETSPSSTTTEISTASTPTETLPVSSTTTEISSTPTETLPVSSTTTETPSSITMESTTETSSVTSTTESSPAISSTIETTSTTTPSTTTQSESPIPECPAEGIQFLPFPGDCNKYYECVGGTPFEFNCPPDLHFNPIALTCEYPETAGCDPSYTTTTEWYSTVLA